MDTLREIVESTEFQTGLEAGAIAVVAAAIVGLVWLAWRRSGPLGVAGLAFAVAALTVLDGPEFVPRVPDELVGGLAALVVAGTISGFVPGSKSRRVGPRLFALGAAIVFAAPGAWLVAERSGIRGPAWFSTVVLVTVMVGGPLAGAFDFRHRMLGAGPVLWLFTVAGVYVCVPDTELAVALLGVAVPLALLGFPIVLGSLGRGGANAAVGVLLWVATFDAVGRPAAMVGVAGSLGLLAMGPLGRLFPGRPLANVRVGRVAGLAIIAAAHAVLVLLATRVAGLEPDLETATLELVPVLVLGVAVGWLLAPFADAGRHRSRAAGVVAA